MPGPPFLEGETVTLRPIEEDDLAFLQRAVNDPAIWRPIGRPEPVNAVQEREFFEEQVCGGEGISLLVTVDDATRVGIVSLTRVDHEAGCAEVGYWIAPDHQREGYASEAVSLLATYGFDQRNFHRLEARVFDCNEGSQQLLESLGFSREGVFRDRVFLDGSYHDALWYGLLAEEWEFAERFEMDHRG